MRTLTVAAIQMAMTDKPAVNHEKLRDLVIQAAQAGAQLILMPELPSNYYFCKRQDPKYFALAESLEDAALIKLMQPLAKQYQVAMPVSFFERAGKVYFNSVAMIDATGELLGVYRKSHIPDGIGYMEKYYFSPGKSGFKVWQTQYGKVGCGICWDQWFPEAARSMVLDGAEVLLYPTAIGSEPHLPNYDSQPHWQCAMQGHAAANMTPVIAANRYGMEADESLSTVFYGSSFITDATGALVKLAARDQEEVLLTTFNLSELAKQRDAWGLFRDRRPDLYQRLTDEA